MPVYEYYCESCHKIFEEWIKTHDTQTPKECPACGGQGRHIISNTSFALKGNGWYATEYGAKKSNEPAGDKNTSADSENSGDSGTSGESGVSGENSPSSETKTAAVDSPASVAEAH
jgi:putative FmdB family regulatory protein